MSQLFWLRTSYVLIIIKNTVLCVAIHVQQFHNSNIKIRIVISLKGLNCNSNKNFIYEFNLSPKTILKPW